MDVVPKPRAIWSLVLIMLTWAEAEAQEKEAEETLPEAVVEMTVTTRKREEKLQKVPVTVTAFSKKTLEATGMESVVDVAAYTPGFSFESAFGRQADRPVFRGMSNILGAPNAGVFIDGVFVSGSIQSTELANIERIEVIKGPQSALFGRSTFAGAINYITRKPTNDPQGEVTATLAEHGQAELSFNHAGPIVKDRLLYHVSARSYQYDGEYVNTVTGDEIGDEETLGFSGSLSYVSARFDAVLRIAYSEDDDGHFPIALQDSSFNNCFLDTSRGYYCGDVRSFDTVSLNTDDLEELGISGLERETLRTSLAMNWDLERATLTSSTAWNGEELTAGIDQDYTAESPFGGAFNTADRGDLTDIAQEIRLSSNTPGALSWIAGLYYYDRKDEDDPLDGSAPDADLETSNIAAFAMVEYEVNPKFTFTIEGRAQEDTIEVRGGAGGDNFKETYSSFNPRATFSYFTSDRTMWFGSVARGNKPGGVNRSAQLPAELRPIEEEESTNYEVGVKSSWQDGRLTWNASGYFIDWTDQQLTSTFQDVVDGDPITISYINNAGETEVVGFETELWATVTPNWDLSLSYAWTDAEFQVYDVAEQEALTGDPSVAGNVTPRAPENQATATVDVHGDMGEDWKWSVRGDVLYEGSRFAQVHNFAETGDSTRVNLRLNFENGAFRVSLWGKNLTDEDAAVSVLRYIDANAFGPPTFVFPRAFGVTLPRGRAIGATGSYRF